MHDEISSLMAIAIVPREQHFVALNEQDSAGGFVEFVSHVGDGAVIFAPARKKYKMVAGAGARFGLNCIYAVRNAIGPLRTGFTWGISASAEVTRYFAPVIMSFPRTVPAVFEAVPELLEFAR